MATHYVCLSFDFDAMSGMVARGLKTPTPLSRGEFGAVGAMRLLDLLERHGLPSSWFIPGIVVEMYPEICERIARAGCEIGHHGYTHHPPATLSREQEEEGLVRGISVIEGLTGAPPAGYRSPSWDLSEHTVELLLSHGFLYDSSMMGHDYSPYRARNGDVVPDDGPVRFGPATRLIEMPVAWSVDDFPHFEFLRTATQLQQGLMNAGHVMENWYDDYEFMARHLEWGLLTYTCHPFVSGRGHRMLALERLIERLVERGARFTTLERVAREFDEREPFAG